VDSAFLGGLGTATGA